jgi:hypothetical protein
VLHDSTRKTHNNKPVTASHHEPAGHRYSRPQPAKPHSKLSAHVLPMTENPTTRPITDTGDVLMVSNWPSRVSLDTTSPASIRGEDTRKSKVTGISASKSTPPANNRTRGRGGSSDSCRVAFSVVFTRSTKENRESRGAAEVREMEDDGTPSRPLTKRWKAMFNLYGGNTRRRGRDGGGG